MGEVENSLRDLGGTEEDIRMLKGVDAEGPSIEGSEAPEGLSDDVTQFWSSLTKSNKPQKTVYDENLDQKPAKSSSKPKEEKKRASQNDRSKPHGGEKTDRKIVHEPTYKPLLGKKKGTQKTRIFEMSHPRTLVIKGEGPWYELALSNEGDSVAVDLLPALKDKARELLQAENEAYTKARARDREYNNSLQFLTSGTFSDQLGSLSILATDSPLHSIKFLESLLSKCEAKNRESATRALEVTKDLLLSHVLPNRRLRWFSAQPQILDIQNLILIGFEDWLKQYYFRLLQVIERLLSDTVEATRVRTLHCTFDLFRSKPEQEANLLRLGLNKLGDPSGKVSSRVKKLVLDTLQEHPGMKPIVASTVKELLERITEYHFRYYAMDMLSDFIMSRKEAPLANQLISIYLEMFERLLSEWSNLNSTSAPQQESVPNRDGKRRKPLRGKKGGIKQEQKTTDQAEEEQRVRLVSKIFSGLNRSFPYSSLSPDLFDKHMDTLYRMSHSSNVGTLIEALSFIHQLSKARSEGDYPGNKHMERLYRALYDSLLDSRLCNSSKLNKYVNLILRAVLDDKNNLARSAAFAKRIGQAATQWPEVGAAASLVYVVSRIPGLDKMGSAEEMYDFRKREPQYAKAETSKLWEMVLLTNHYHPTVSLYARNVLVPQQDLDMPDTSQHTVANFLAKWSYEKPRERENTRGGSIFQRLSGYTDIGLGVRQQAAYNAAPASIQDWTNRSSQQVAPDEQFFLEYFKDRPRRDKTSKTNADKSDESGTDEEEIFDVITKSNGAELDDDDLGFSDMDSDPGDEGLAAAMDSAEDGSDDKVASEDDLQAGSNDEGFSDFDMPNESDQESDQESSPLADTANVEETPQPESSKRKRKRNWSGMPTFMDADEFAIEMAKRRK